LTELFIRCPGYLGITGILGGLCGVGGGDAIIRIIAAVIGGGIVVIGILVRCFTQILIAESKGRLRAVFLFVTRAAILHWRINMGR
jgi:hypothetical protein